MNKELLARHRKFRKLAEGLPDKDRNKLYAAMFSEIKVVDFLLDCNGWANTVAFPATLTSCRYEINEGILWDLVQKHGKTVVDEDEHLKWQPEKIAE